ncbi:MAG: AsmA-like C-terminal region-containing protein [Bacteroidales bacterium]
MKKIIRIIGITLGVILLLLAILPFLFKSKIETLVKQEVNKQVHATVNWEKFGLSFFRGFPDLSINLHELSVVGIDTFAGDTLVGLKRFELRVSPFSAFKKEVIVKSILLDRPVINGMVLEDGTANWDIVPVAEPGPEVPEEREEKPEEPGEKKPEVSEDTESGSSMGISLKMFAINNARIRYSDLAGGLSASVADFNLKLKGDFSEAQSDMDLLLTLHGIDATSGLIPYMKNGSVEMDLVASADMVNSIYTLKQNEIRINGLVLGAEGTVSMPDDGSIIPDIRFFTRETSFHTLLSMVPAIYMTDFESLETSGSLSLDGTVSGVMKDSIMPDATLNLVVNDGFFSYPDLPKDVSDVQISLKVDYRGADMDATTVNLDRFHLLLGGNPFDIALQVTHPFSDMHVAGMVKGAIDFATLADIIPMEDLNMSGKLDTDLAWDTRMSYIENEQYEQVKLEGRLVIEEMLIEAADIPVPVQLKRMAMAFTPRYVNLESMDLLLGSSDLHLDGRLTNFIPYVFNDQIISGTLNVSSTLLDANEFTEETESAPADKPVTVQDTVTEKMEIPADSLAEPAQVKIPENINFTMMLDMKKVLYDNIVVENLAGKMSVKDGVANLEGLKMNILKGSVAIEGLVDTRGEFTSADVHLNLSNIDIPASYETFVAIEKLAPVARHCKGSANVVMDLNTLLDASMNPLYESLEAKGRLSARNLKVEQPASLEKLSSLLKNEKLKNLELDKAEINFVVHEGRVIVEPFAMNFEASKMTASGSHGIDQTMNYFLDMNIAKSDMGSGANELMNSVGALAAGAGLAIPQSDFIKVIANITGTFSDPKVTTDLSGNISKTKETVTAAVKEKVTEEIEKVQDQVKEEASARAESLIKNAEAEKARLVEQAEAAGAKLVAEAEKKGDQLIKEAGNNPLKKIAANKAAEELVKKAESQSARLIEEAESKGDALIERAREEAGKI